jgi:phosphoribosylglycinamide formyltransferase-1
MRVAVLASGRGSNLQALIDARFAGALDVELVGVFSDKAKAIALERARTHNIPAVSARPARPLRPARVRRSAVRRGRRGEPALIVCAGYMRLISPEVVERYAGRMINIHPSLLPAYQGLKTHARVLAAGDAVHGASVHFVTAELDGGPVIAQVRMDVLEDDTPDAMAQRLLPLEHKLLVATVALLARRHVFPTPFGIAIDGRLQKRRSR